MWTLAAPWFRRDPCCRDHPAGTHHRRPGCETVPTHGPGLHHWSTTINASQLNESTIGRHHRGALHPCPSQLPYRRPLPGGGLCGGEELRHRRRHQDQPSDLCGRQRRGPAGELRLRHRYHQPHCHKKFRCTIGDDAFWAAIPTLIAPVTVGTGPIPPPGPPLPRPMERWPSPGPGRPTSPAGPTARTACGRRDCGGSACQKSFYQPPELKKFKTPTT